MQAEFQLENNNFKEKKRTVLNQIILTNRDLEIIKFINEMKFSSLDEIHFKFFKTLKDGTESKSQWWARERLSDLAKAKYIIKRYSFNERKSYYLGTMKGYLALLKRYPSDVSVKPLAKIDFSTFDHDKLVMQIRLQYEQQGVIKNWISDRMLQSMGGAHKVLGEGNTPDGIYTTTDDEKIAFELELTQKAKSRYEQKIKKYVSIIRENKNNNDVFKKVHFIACSDKILEHLSHYSKLYKDFFRFDLLQVADVKNGVLV